MRSTFYPITRSSKTSTQLCRITKRSVRSCCGCEESLFFTEFASLFLADHQQQRSGGGAAALHESRSARERGREDPCSDQPPGHDAQQPGTQAALQNLNEHKRRPCNRCSVQEWLLRQVCASEAVEPVISSLVSVLLNGCQDASPEARLLCGECLGELGAVDPGRLDLSHTHSNGDRNTFVVRYLTL